MMKVQKLSGQALALVLAMTLLWIHAPIVEQLAWAQVNAMARWDFNDPPNTPSDDGVADVAGLPNPDFPGDAHSGLSRCSDAQIETPRGPAGSTYGDCLKFDSEEFVSGDSDESVLDSGADPGVASTYLGDRTVMAWVRALGTTANYLSGDRAIVSIGNADVWSYTKCDQDMNDSHCSEFILSLTDGFPTVGNGQGDDPSKTTVVCDDDDFDIDAAGNLETWFFIVGTYDQTDEEDQDEKPASTRIYVNGSLCKSGRIRQARTAQGAGASWGIGGFLNDSANPSGGWFVGAMDDVRVFDRELGAAEIAALWQSSANGGL